jgi:TRAP-type C4-dicarboxylate transport system permease large subunit
LFSLTKVFVYVHITITIVSSVFLVLCLVSQASNFERHYKTRQFAKDVNDVMEKSVLCKLVFLYMMCLALNIANKINLFENRL